MVARWGHGRVHETRVRFVVVGGKAVDMGGLWVVVGVNGCVGTAQ